MKTWATILMGGVALCAITPAWAETREFDVRPQDARTGVPEFARQAGLQILVAGSDVAGVQIRSLQGEYDVREGLKTLLSGTGLVVASDDGRTVSLRRMAQGAAGAASPGGAAQDERSVGVEEVVVTAQRRAERLQDVPIAVSVLTLSDIQAAGATDTTMLASAIPGLAISTEASNFTPRIRGIGTAAIGPGIENPVALVVDDVYYGSQIMGIAGLEDVNQISVLKGPQGTLFGRNTTGGVIQLTTREPQMEFGGEFRTELDNYLTSRSYAHITGGLADSIAASLSVGYTTQVDGWGKNIATGKDVFKTYHDLSARSKLLFTPGSETRIRFSMDYTDRINSLGPNIVSAPGTTAIVPGFTPSSNIHDVSVTLDNRTKTQFGGTSLRIEQGLGFAQLVSTTAYRQYYFHTRFDPSLGPTPLQFQVFEQDGHQISQELQLLSPESETFTWQAGLYYYSAEDRMPTADQENFFPNSFPFSHQHIFFTNTVTTDSKAAYAQATTLILPKTRLTAGIRYTMETRKVDGYVDLDFAPSIFAPAVLERLANKDKHNYYALTYRIALDHKFTPDILGYISFNRGFKSGGFNGFNPTDPSYAPETVNTYELGFKSELFGRRLRINNALFYNEYKNIQVLQLGGFVTITNAGSAVTYGDDLDMELAVSRDLRLTGGLEVLHATFTDYKSAEFYADGFAPLGLPGGVTLFHAPATGRWLPNAPAFTANIGLDYTKELRFGTITFNVNNYYSSGFYGQPNNEKRQSAYNYLNTSLTWSEPDGQLSVTLFATNLLDRPVVNALSGLNPRGWAAEYGTPPRIFGGRVKISF